MLPEETLTRHLARIGYASLVFLSFIKLLSLLQIHEDFGFLVKMVQVVVVQLIPFFILFISLIIIFAFSLFALNLPIAENDTNNDYQGMNWVGLEYFLHVLRTALGDFQPNGYKRMHSPTLYVSWAIWILLVMLDTVIFLNFLIAVISDVFA